MKSKIIILFICLICNNIILAQGRAEMVIKPLPERGGNVTVCITDLVPKNYPRFILVPLPVEVEHFVSLSDSLHKFSGFWYVDNNAKTQIWIGNVLTPQQTELKMEFDLQKIIASGEKKDSSYIILNAKYYDGFHNYLPAKNCDSIEIVFVDRVKVNSNGGYQVSEVIPEKYGEKTSLNQWTCEIGANKHDSNIYILFNVPTQEKTLKCIRDTAISSIGSWLSALLLVAISPIKRFFQKHKGKIYIGVSIIALLFILLLFIKAKKEQLDISKAFLYIGVIIAFIFGLIIPNKYNILKLLYKKLNQNIKD